MSLFSIDSKMAGTFVTGSILGALIMLAIEKRRQNFAKKPRHGLRTAKSQINMSNMTWLHKEFHYSTKELIAMAKEIQSEYQKGLSGVEGAHIPMIPSYITKLPTGAEKGDYIALDMGGTNFRVLRITLLGDGTTKIKATKDKFSEAAMSGEASELFGYMADKILKFIPDAVNSEKEFPLGFTFSFPLVQTAHDRGTLLRWTKGFDVKGVVNQEVVSLLQKELDKRNLNISTKAICNDTVGTLMTRALTDKNCLVGFIIGTGCNAAYVEKAASVKKFAHAAPQNGFRSNDIVIVNTEMGNFSGETLRRTRVDNVLDTASAHPGTHFWEKMVSGMYLGEITRLLVVMFFEEGLIFSRCGLAEIWKYKDSFKTEIMAQIEQDEDPELRFADAILERQMDTFGSTLNDRTFIKSICKTISKRAARVAGAGVFATLLQLNQKKVTVAVDGSVFKLYPMFHHRLRDAVECMIQETGLKTSVDIVDAEDGSGVGAAAIVAALVG